MIIKKEEEDTEIEDHGVVGMYLMLVKILKLPAIKELVIMLLTVRVCKAFFIHLFFQIIILYVDEKYKFNLFL